MLVGLTGGIATGKSSAADLFKLKGCYTLDADSVSRIVMSPDGAAYPQIVDYFGTGILSPDGTIDRGKLREIILTNTTDKIALEKIVHKQVAWYSNKQYRAIKGKDDKAIVIYHAPLLIEAAVTAGNIGQYDAILLMWCNEQTQLKRLKERGSPPFEDSVKFLKSQMPYHEKLKFATHVLDNNSDYDNLKSEVDRVYNLLQLIRYSEKRK